MLYIYCQLHYFDINIDSRRQRKIGQSIHYFGRRIDDINHSAVHPHFKLLTGVFVDERRAVDSVLFYFGRQWYRTNNFSVITQSRIDYLLNREIQNLIFISHHSDAQLRDRFFFFNLRFNCSFCFF